MLGSAAKHLIMLYLAGMATDHLIDGDVLRLLMTAQGLLRGKFRLMPRIGGLFSWTSWARPSNKS
jgi:hypothetical protein